MERLLRVAGALVGILGGVLTALWEIMLSPPHSYGLAVLAVAVVSNATLVWFTRLVTGVNGLALLPGLAWFVTMFTGTIRTTEGDLLIPGTDWTGLLTILLGMITWGLAAYRLVVRHRTS
jgi:hypothetical protein